MPIRGSIKPPPKRGYPDIKFEGYVTRFGHVQASFITPGMRALMGEYVLPPGRRPKVEIRMYYRHGLVNLIAERTANNLPVRELKEVLNNWPTLSQSDKLTADPYRQLED